MDRQNLVLALTAVGAIVALLLLARGAEPGSPSLDASSRPAGRPVEGTVEPRRRTSDVPEDPASRPTVRSARPVATEVDRRPPGSAVEGPIRTIELGPVGIGDGGAIAEEPEGPILDDRVLLEAARRHLGRVFSTEERDAEGQPLVDGETYEVALEVIGILHDAGRATATFRASVFDHAIVLDVVLEARTGRIVSAASLAPATTQFVRVRPDAARRRIEERGVLDAAATDLVLSPTRRLAWRFRRTQAACGQTLGQMAGLLVDVDSGRIVAEEYYARSTSVVTDYEIETRPIVVEIPRQSRY